MILLNPGPVTLNERVHKAFLREDLCHREPEFAALTRDIRERLLRVYPQTEIAYTAILLSGSGTCAVESMLASLIPEEGKALVVSNGVYGERMESMITTHGKNLKTVASPWTEAMNMVAVEQQLKHDRGISHVVAVHHETTTGRLNDMEALGKLCKKYGVALLLDSVSAFGAERIDWEAWNVEACAATANKCLHGAPGISFVLVKESVFHQRASAARSLYLDLFSYYKAQKTDSTPYTQAVHVCYALQEALKILEEEGGWEARQEQYRQRALRVRKKLRQLDVHTLLASEDYASVLTSFLMPEGMSYQYLHDALKKAGFIIYAGQGRFKEAVFRIATMGALPMEAIDRLLHCFDELFSKPVQL